MPTRRETPASVESPPELAFRFSNGASARSLREMLDVVTRSELGTIEYHRPHYGYWIRDVIRDPELAATVDVLATKPELAGDAYRDALVDAVRSVAEPAKRTAKRAPKTVAAKGGAKDAKSPKRAKRATK